ncbi:MAG: bifunctional diguanylate cyclase/phosphodiesterase [Spirochaetaceae bacterium]|nr:bifunctional diguanylate cyclase/phosphodiesterase [Spirochaetaceae bacterium]
MQEKVFFELISTYSSEGILIVQFNEKSQDYTLSYANPQFNAILGKDVSETDDFINLLENFSQQENWQEKIQTVIQNSIEEKLVFSLNNFCYELCIKKLPQNYLFFLLRDITSYKKQEEALKEQNIRLASLSEELILSQQRLKFQLEKIECLNTRLEFLAYHDTLTTLHNRVKFNEEIEKEIEETIQQKKKLALILINIDNLKTINDSKGHSEGDKLICSTAKILKTFENDTISVFRFGGDEFIVLIRNSDSRKEIQEITNSIFTALKKQNISVSGGVSVAPEDSEKSSELLKYADMAMSEVKKTGKKNYFFFKQLMQETFLQKVNLETKLTEAIDSNQFQLYFQPQMDIASNKIRGFEALLRWYDKDLGWISPSQFIPMTEESKLIIPLGSWVLEQACATLAQWQKDYNFDGIMSINVSPIQLKKHDFLPELTGLLEKYAINPKFLELEITEGILIDNMEETVAILEQVKKMGIGISLDDFGTGYSSLSYLQILPLTTLKIDKSFIANITSKDSVEADITDAIIALVTKMGLDTIAEGVENEEQLDVLKQIQCKNTQGFLMGKPMSTELCQKLLAGDKDALLTNQEDA